MNFLDYRHKGRFEERFNSAAMSHEMKMISITIPDISLIPEISLSQISHYLRQLIPEISVTRYPNDLIHST